MWMKMEYSEGSDRKGHSIIVNMFCAREPEINRESGRGLPLSC